MERRLLIGFLIAPVFVAGAILFTGHTASSQAGVTWRLLLVSVVMYPVCEEIIFRGLIQGELGKRYVRDDALSGFRKHSRAADVFPGSHIRLLF